MVNSKHLDQVWQKVLNTTKLKPVRAKLSAWSSPGHQLSEVDLMPITPWSLHLTALLPQQAAVSLSWPPDLLKSVVLPLSVLPLQFPWLPSLPTGSHQWAWVALIAVLPTAWLAYSFVAQTSSWDSTAANCQVCAWCPKEVAISHTSTSDELASFL